MKYIHRITILALVLTYTVKAQVQFDDAQRPNAPLQKSQIVKYRPSQPLSTTSASLPLKMSYQGILTTVSGTPVADGAYDLVVSFYDSIAAGNVQWSEVHIGVPVKRGTFSVTLGTTTPLSLQFNLPLFVQVSATNGPAGPSYPLTFSPRSELTSSPYSLGPWVTNGSDIYYKTGRIGIGSTTPESSAVSGSIRLEIADEDGYNSDIGMRTAQGGFSSLDFAKSNGTLAAPTIVNQEDRLGLIDFYGHDGSSFQVAAGIYCIIDSTTGPGVMPTRLTFYTRNQANGYAKRLQLDRNGSLCIDPWAFNTGKLSPGLTFGASYYTGEGISSKRSFGGNQWGLDFYTAFINRMSITNSGNVGIGTSAPTHKFHVYSDSGETVLGIQNTNATGGHLWQLYSTGIGNIQGAGNFMIRDSNSSAVRMFISGSTGNFGIGTSTPTTSLSVSGGADISGNVGIGTSSPVEKLTVAGSMNLGTGAAPYQHLSMSGGNSSGFLFGSYGGPSPYGDGIHLGYNAYHDGSGNLVVPNAGGPTSRISVGYGYIGLFVGGVDADPTTVGVYVNGVGNVGIGTSFPTQKLCIAGNISYSGFVAGCSDIRYKMNITPLSSSLSKVCALKGVNYNWRTEEFPEKNFTKEKQIGLIAQEVEKIYPEVVLTDQNGYKSIDYGHLTPALVEAVKELHAKNEKLEARLAELESAMKRLLTEKKMEQDKSIGELK